MHNQENIGNAEGKIELNSEYGQSALRALNLGDYIGQVIRYKGKDYKAEDLLDLCMQQQQARAVLNGLVSFAKYDIKSADEATRASFQAAVELFGSHVLAIFNPDSTNVSANGPGTAEPLNQGPNVTA
jgi:hypothetical protein